MATYRKINEWKSSFSRRRRKLQENITTTLFWILSVQRHIISFLETLSTLKVSPCFGISFPTTIFIMKTRDYGQHARYGITLTGTRLNFWNLAYCLALRTHFLTPNSRPVTYVDDYWLEYYRPLAISSFVKIFSWKISSRPRYLHDGTPQEVSWDPSPFVPRKLPQEPDLAWKENQKRGHNP